MWNRSIALPRRKEQEQDKEGFFKEEIYDWERGIPASFTDITRNDEILAAHKGYQADQNIEIMACNYQGQSFSEMKAITRCMRLKEPFKKTNPQR